MSHSRPLSLLPACLAATTATGAVEIALDPVTGGFALYSDDFKNQRSVKPTVGRGNEVGGGKEQQASLDFAAGGTYVSLAEHPTESVLPFDARAVSSLAAATTAGSLALARSLQLKHQQRQEIHAPRRQPLLQNRWRAGIGVLSAVGCLALARRTLRRARHKDAATTSPTAHQSCIVDLQTDVATAEQVPLTPNKQRPSIECFQLDSARGKCQDSPCGLPTTPSDAGASSRGEYTGRLSLSEWWDDKVRLSDVSKRLDRGLPSTPTDAGASSHRDQTGRLSLSAWWDDKVRLNGVSKSPDHFNLSDDEGNNEPPISPSYESPRKTAGFAGA
eukprot:TRINITY_DN33118_c0_g1_i1.p1 TRINITY_DN33118_c0_g1~~TRINITY_DN33118_c0_g1_i1.p1  ORF type:complete len:331 (-),score=49.89 TRINITY_DN33118_c0_g1_i1:27-1019(-)